MGVSMPQLEPEQRADHDHVAVGEVEHARRREHDAQTKGDQAVDTADLDTTDHGVEKAIHARVSQGASVAPVARRATARRCASVNKSRTRSTASSTAEGSSRTPAAMSPAPAYSSISGSRVRTRVTVHSIGSLSAMSSNRQMTFAPSAARM